MCQTSQSQGTLNNHQLHWLTVAWVRSFGWAVFCSLELGSFTALHLAGTRVGLEGPRRLHSGAPARPYVVFCSRFSPHSSVGFLVAWWPHRGQTPCRAASERGYFLCKDIASIPLVPKGPSLSRNSPQGLVYWKGGSPASNTHLVQSTWFSTFSGTGEWGGNKEMADFPGAKTSPSRGFIWERSVLYCGGWTLLCLQN